ncbi:MAG TPA: hypothetical protein VKE27_00375 [Candidatus Dormibacteraeota bacterium]|nr:hypothetical protein [Candidatus Dormibacteraeota bacterium]
MWRWLTRTSAATLAAGLLAAPAVQASNGPDESALAGVRNATSAFHDLHAAGAAGYAPLLSCFDLLGVGGMGQHYANTSLLDATVDANRPEALVYEIDGDRLQLVAVEYIVPWQAWVSLTPPQLYGRSFFRVDSLHLWALHAWIWRPNPLGIFANYNPNVKLCPGH